MCFAVEAQKEFHSGRSNKSPRPRPRPTYKPPTKKVVVEVTTKPTRPALTTNTKRKWTTKERTFYTPERRKTTQLPTLPSTYSPAPAIIITKRPPPPVFTTPAWKINIVTKEKPSQHVTPSCRCYSPRSGLQCPQRRRPQLRRCLQV